MTSVKTEHNVLSIAQNIELTLNTNNCFEGSTITTITIENKKIKIKKHEQISVHKLQKKIQISVHKLQK